jgi:hypothetical protein
MARRALAVLCFGILSLFMASCGQTYHLDSITVSPKSFYLEGPNAPTPLESQPLTVTGNYSNTKTEIVTTGSTYQVDQATGMSDPNTPTGAVFVNGTSGVVEVSPRILACTFKLNSTGTGYVTTSPYVVTVTYQGQQDTAAVYVDTMPNCHDTTQTAP